jgi:hypothetical protein
VTSQRTQSAGSAGRFGGIGAAGGVAVFAGRRRMTVCWASDEAAVQQLGPEQDGFFAFYATEVLPRLR